MSVLDDAREMAGGARVVAAGPAGPGINLIEVMAWEAVSEVLAASSTGEFPFVGAPSNVRGATAASIRPPARVAS